MPAAIVRRRLGAEPFLPLVGARVALMGGARAAGAVLFRVLSSRKVWLKTQAMLEERRSEDAGDEPLPAIHGPLRRNRGLLIAIGLMLLVSPMLTRVSSSYRGVVLEIKDDQMWVGFSGRPPRWIDRIEAPPGALVAKSAGRWNPSVVEATTADHDLIVLHLRYVDRYTGVIVEIRPPLSPQGASVAVIRTDDGRRIEHALWADHLATAAVERRVEKRPHTWDFDLVDAPPPARH